MSRWGGGAELAARGADSSNALCQGNRGLAHDSRLPYRGHETYSSAHSNDGERVLWNYLQSWLKSYLQ